MKRLHKKILPLIISALLGTGAIGAIAATESGAGLQETIVVEPGRSISSRQADIISRSAAKVLAHIAEARSAIQVKDRSRADKQLGDARALLEIIKAESPTTKVIDHITVAKKHLDYKETESIGADLVPIYEDLAQIEDLVPVQQARQQLEKTKQALKKGDKQKAKASLTAVQDALIYTELDLPISSTERYVIVAQSELSKGKYKQADKALDAAEAGVVYLSVEVESPLAQARNDLYLARQDYAAERYREVKQDLVAASRWLDRVAQNTDKATIKEAKTLKIQIDNLASKLDQKDKGLAKSIEGTWHKLTAMAEREAEKASIGWKKTRPNSDIRADLIDAKQRVAFAENMQFYAESDPADILKALDQAKGELDKVAAAGKLDSKGSKELDQALKEIAMIRQDPKQRNVYEIIRSRLRGLIHNDY